MCFLLSKPDDALNKLTQRPSVPQKQQHVRDTVNTIGENTDIEQLLQKEEGVRSFSSPGLLRLQRS